MGGPKNGYRCKKLVCRELLGSVIFALFAGKPVADAFHAKMSAAFVKNYIRQFGIAAHHSSDGSARQKMNRSSWYDMRAMPYLINRASDLMTR